MWGEEAVVEVEVERLLTGEAVVSDPIPVCSNLANVRARSAGQLLGRSCLEKEQNYNSLNRSSNACTLSILSLSLSTVFLSAQDVAAFDADADAGLTGVKPS